MQNLKDKVMLITGATSGIGRALALQANELGAKLILCGRSEDKMQKLLLDLGSESVYAKTFDITQEDQTIAFIQAGVKYFGKIDILVNNAGANSAKAKVADIKTSDYEYMIRLNQIAPFIVMREVFKNMRQRQEGRIVNILSTVCLYSNPGIGSYTGSKDGFDGMTKVFRKEAAEEGVVVSAVYPGGVDTDFRELEREDYLTAYTVAEAIINLLQMNPEAAMHELVLRPHVEKNF